MQSPFPSRQDCQHTGWSWSILTRTYERGRTLRCKVFDYFHGWLYKKKRLIDFFFCFLKSRKLPYVSCSKKWLRRKGVCYILCERSDNGGFFCSSDRTKKKKRNQAPYTPKLNGVAERKNKTIVDMAKLMLKGHDDRKEHV